MSDRSTTRLLFAQLWSALGHPLATVLLAMLLIWDASRLPPHTVWGAAFHPPPRGSIHVRRCVRHIPICRLVREAHGFTAAHLTDAPDEAVITGHVLWSHERTGRWAPTGSSTSADVVIIARSETLSESDRNVARETALRYMLHAEGGRFGHLAVLALTEGGVREVWWSGRIRSALALLCGVLLLASLRWAPGAALAAARWCERAMRSPADVRRASLGRGRCPRCGYDIRRLPAQQCPECGERWTSVEAGVRR